MSKQWEHVRYCICGGVLRISASQAASTHMLDWWQSVHTGPGHAETDAAGARKAQRAWDKSEHGKVTITQEEL
jgi:hypothetical protein